MKRYGWAVMLLSLALTTLACKGGLIDLGFIPEDKSPEIQEISGFAWQDDNWDGQAQDTEQRLQGLTVRIYRRGIEEPLFTTMTGEGGSYAFKTPVTLLEYTVEFETPAGHTITYKDTGPPANSSHIHRHTGRSDSFKLIVNFNHMVNGGFVPLLTIEEFIQQVLAPFTLPNPNQDDSLDVSCGAVLPAGDDNPLDALLKRFWFWFYEGKCGSTAFTLSNGATYGAFSPGAASAPPAPGEPQASTNGDVLVAQLPREIEPVSEPGAVNPAPESESAAALIGPFTTIDLAATGLSGLGGLFGLVLIMSGMFAARRGLQTPVTPIQGRPGDDFLDQASARDVLLGAQPPATDGFRGEVLLSERDTHPGEELMRAVIDAARGTQPPVADRPPMAAPPKETTDCQKLVDIVLQLDFQNLPRILGTTANEFDLSDRMREIVDRLRQDCLEEVPEMKSIDPNLPPERQLQQLAGELKLRLSRLGGEEVIL